MREINPAFIEVAKAYDFTVEYCEETDKIIIQGKDGQNAFWWDSSEDDAAFWREIKTYFYEQGYNVAARW